MKYKFKIPLFCGIYISDSGCENELEILYLIKKMYSSNSYYSQRIHYFYKNIFVVEMYHTAIEFSIFYSYVTSGLAIMFPSKEKLGEGE